MKLFCCIILGAFMVMSASCSHNSKETRRMQTVKIDTVFSVEGQTPLQFPGKVKAAQDVNLSFRVSGTIGKICVEDGARVRKGQLLAQLDPTDYRIQLEATEAEYQQVKAEAERVMALYKDNGTTPNANDKAVYGLKQITAKYQHHKDQLEYTNLYAPFDGFVQKHLFDEHETVGAGMFIRYHATFDIYPGKFYPLECISITPKANANQLYSMRLRIVQDGKPSPSPGMNTMVTVFCSAGDMHSLSVSSGAVLQKNGKAAVFVYDPSKGTVRSCEVTVLRLLTNGRSVITSDALQPGELVVSSGVHHIEDGEVVKPLPPITSTNVGGLL